MTERRGWMAVVAMLLVQAVSSGLGFYNMSVYVVEMATMVGAPLSSLSAAVALFFVSGGLAGLYVARLMRDFDLRWIMTLGSLIAGAALAATAYAESVWQLYVLFTLFGLGNTGVSIVVATTLITRWFPGPERSIALSISSTGLSLGGVTLTPLTALVFNEIGVRASMPLLGVTFIVLIVPFVWLLVRPPPEQSVGASPEADASELSIARGSRFFILLCAGYVLCMGAQVGGIAHLYGRVLAMADFAIAAYAVQALSLGSILGRFAGGVVASRIPVARFTLAALALQLVGLVLIALAGSAWFAVLAAFVFGLSVGNLLMSQPLWIAEVFSVRIYAQVFALANAISIVGVAGGPFLMGLMIDGQGYTSAFLFAALFCVLAFVLLGMAAREPQNRKPVEELST